MGSRSRQPFLPFSSSLVALVALGVASVAGCECAPAARMACATNADCRGSEVCLDRRCVRGTADAGDPTLDAPLADVPRSDSGPAPDAVCAAVTSEAREIRRPVDIIVLPDESGSMGPARDSVAAAMQGVVRTVLEASTVDYRVIWHGATPLPALAGRVFYNSVLLGSGPDAMFAPVLDTYGSWSPMLRADAQKVVVHFTDATSGDGGSITGYTGTFDTVLFGLDPTVWGDASAPRFVYHTFIGLPARTPIDLPYEPTDPIETGASCSGSFVNAIPLQEMAIRTGGLRFPLCFFDEFDAVFQRIAEAAVDRSVVACELELPEPPAGMTIDPATIAIRYTNPGGTDEVLLQAASAAECTAGAFLLETDRVRLCPDACARVEADPMAVLTLLSGCDPELY